MSTKNANRFVLIALLGAGLVRCAGTDFGSTGQSGSKSSKKGGKAESEDPDTDKVDEGKDPEKGDEPNQKVTDDSDDSNADDIFDDGDGNRREAFSFGKGSQPPVVDYLFVVDNSPSMGDNVAQMQAGFASLTESLFPKKTRVAVMNTMPAKPGDLSQSYNGKDQQSLAAANAEPGFMGLVDKARIAAYVAAGGADKAFPSPGCDEAWFAPGDKDSKGTRCFDAHTPITKKGGPCEAGIVSFSQYVEKMAGKRVFRKGALANVVFVSDTHDPGCPKGGKKDLDAIRPDHAKLKQAVDKNSSGLASLKFHAIAPSGACKGSEGQPESGTTYYAMAAASKGQKLDLCQTNDFKGVLQKIVEDTSVERAVFKLSKPAKEIEAVKVDGKKVDDYELIDGDTVEVKGLDPTQKVAVEITYSY